MKSSHLTIAALLTTAAHAQQSLYGQCGGVGWSGATNCVSGASCSVLNQYYSQCLPGSVGSSPSSSTSVKSAASSTTKIAASTTTSTSPAATGFKWLGVDESGAEFGSTAIPGVYGKNFIFPADSSLSTLMQQGFNIFRVPFLMERMMPGSITAALSPAYLANYTATINYITNAGGWAVIDPHNYGRYNGAIITDTSSFQTFWNNLASTFKSNPKVILDTNNEYNTMDQTLVLNLNQAAINGIRAAGATSQYIFAEGNAWTGAWSWVTTNNNMKALTDPENKTIYEMHQYLDSDDSGTSATCVSTTIGVERVTNATAWLRENNKIGIIGEFVGGANDVCMTAITGMLSYLKENSDVWTGAIWWGGGPWWGDYIYGFEPPSSAAYNYYDTLLKSYAP